MVVDTTQQIGHAQEAVAETDPINAANAKYWLHGINTRDFSNMHPVERHVWRQIYRGNSRMPADQELIATQVGQLSFGFVPVNLIPYYLLLGSSSTDGGGIHTITPLASGSLPTFTQRSESTGGTVDKIFSAVGCKVVRLDGFYTRFRAIPTLTQAITYVGIKNVTPSFNGIHTTGVKYPTDTGAMGGTETKLRFKRDSNFAFVWDNGGSNDDYKDDIMMFQYSIINAAILQGIQTQAELEFIDEGNYVVTTRLGIMRGADKAIYTDYLAQKTTPSTRQDLRFKIYAGGTNYQELIFNNIALGSCDAPYKKGDEDYLWQAEGTADSITITGKDGISKTEFYGE